MRNDKLREINRNIQKIMRITPSEIMKIAKESNDTEEPFYKQFRGCNVCDEVRR